MSQQVGEEGDLERVSVRYLGPALEANSMDVRQLAPSLLALADLFTIAHSELGPTLTPPPALEVTAQRGGSFIVDLWLTASEATDDLVRMLNTPYGTAGGVAFGIASPTILAIRWAVLRRRKGRETSVTELDPGIVQVNWADGTSLQAPTKARDLVERMDFNRTAAQVFEPLRKEGFEGIELRRSRRGRVAVQANLEREDLRAFNAPPEDDEVLSDNTRIVNVSIVSLPFNRDNKWRVDDGTAVIWASLHDEGFLRRMEAGVERFAVGDRLSVQMRDRQLRTAENGITVEHTIQKVIKHHSVPPPDELPFDND